jgi:hypothetical protein
MHRVSEYMKVWNIILACNVLMLFMTNAMAQKRGVVEPLNWAEGRVVDAELSDWGATLSKSHSGQELHYELANDQSNIYVAIRIVDMQRQIQAVTRGVSFMINTEGRRRPGSSVIFPVVDRIGFRAKMAQDQEEALEIRSAALASVRSIGVADFDQLPNGQISMSNDFGIEAVASIDEDDALVIEISVPIGLLGGYDRLRNKELAYQIRINTMQQQAPAVRPAPGLYGVNRGPVYGAGRTKQEPGVWGQILLAEMPN